MEKMDWAACRKGVMENISYSQLVEEYGAEDVGGVTDLITDILTSAQPIVRIGKEDLPLSVVQSRFRKLDETHMVFQLHFLIPLLLSLYHIGVAGDSLSTRPICAGLRKVCGGV